MGPVFLEAELWMTMNLVISRRTESVNNMHCTHTRARRVVALHRRTSYLCIESLQCFDVGIDCLEYGIGTDVDQHFDTRWSALASAPS